MNDKNLKLMLKSADESLEISMNPKIFIPYFVNIAFSCQLYLKYIIYEKTSILANGHNLLDLYSKTKSCIDDTEFLKHLLEVTTLTS